MGTSSVRLPAHTSCCCYCCCCCWRSHVQSMQSPLWALLSVGAVTTLSAVAIGSLMWTNQHLSQQLKQRDRVGTLTHHLTLDAHAANMAHTDALVAGLSCHSGGMLQYVG